MGTMLCAVIWPKGFISEQPFVFCLPADPYTHSIVPSGSVMSLHYFSFNNVHLNGHKQKGISLLVQKEILYPRG